MRKLQVRDKIPGVFLRVRRRVPGGDVVLAERDGCRIPGMWIKLSIAHQRTLSFTVTDHNTSLLF